MSVSRLSLQAKTTTPSQVGLLLRIQISYAFSHFFLFQRGPLTHRHSGCGCTACSAFPLECTVDPWWQGTGLPGSAAAAGTRTSTVTRRSTPTWDSLRARAHQRIPLSKKDFWDSFEGNPFECIALSWISECSRLLSFTNNSNLSCGHRLQQCS